jgi:hypothetical protein
VVSPLLTPRRRVASSANFAVLKVSFSADATVEDFTVRWQGTLTWYYQQRTMARGPYMVLPATYHGKGPLHGTTSNVPWQGALTWYYQQYTMARGPYMVLPGIYHGKGALHGTARNIPWQVGLTWYYQQRTMARGPYMVLPGIYHGKGALHGTTSRANWTKVFLRGVTLSISHHFVLACDGQSLASQHWAYVGGSTSSRV